MRIDAHFLLQGKEKNQSKVATEECRYLPFRGLRPISCADKYAHVLFSKEKKSKRQITFRSIDTLFFAISVSSFHSPCMHICVAMFDVHKDTHIFLHGKEKSKRRMLFFRCFCLFFSVPKYAHVYCRGKRRAKGKRRWKSAVICLFPALSLFFSAPLPAQASPEENVRKGWRYSFFQGKRKNQRRVLFSRGLRPFLVCVKMHMFFFSGKKEKPKDDGCVRV